MVGIIQKNINNQQALVQELCNMYPDKANVINNMIGQGQNPKDIVMNMLKIF